jgi:hypothetical protein
LTNELCKTHNVDLFECAESIPIMRRTQYLTDAIVD